MSGQYPPPNPGHPFTRAPTLPPWGQTTGINMVGSSMNFYGSPHVGLPGRGGQQSWVPQQTHPKPADPNPVYGLQMLMSADGGQRRPPVSEYQQEETMDLSSHSTTPAEPKRMETSDPLRNGTILPAEVNGETEPVRTEQDISESAVTSVIASNPLRESVIDVLNCAKTTENSVLKRVEQSQIMPESLKIANTLAMDTSPSEATDSVNSSFVSSVLKTTSCVEPVITSDPVSSGCDSVIERSSQDVEQDSVVEKSADLPDSALIANDSDLNESQSSYLESSTMTVDTDESKLVVAESPADEIFGMSPQPQPEKNFQPEKLFSQASLASSQESFGSGPTLSLSRESTPSVVVLSSQDSIKTETREIQQAEVVTKQCSEVVSLSSESNLSSATSTTATVLPPSVGDSEPHPSVENVEILLESMFNSQEETSCSSQASAGVPQSVIVSNGSRASGDIFKAADIITPMKEEELAKTLAEDDSIVDDTDVKEEKKEEKITDDIMDEIEKKLEMLTESNSIAQNFDVGHSKMEVSENPKEEPCDDKHVDMENLNQTLSNEPPKQKVEEITSKPNTDIEMLTPKTETGQSSNPFIEVETELEKMFAGIVEPADEACSDNQSQSVVSEPKKPVTNRKPVAKRKKANSRRPSDNSVFGGSSGESTPVRKKGRKRLNDAGSEKISNRKAKTEGGDSGRRGRLPKDTSNDSLSKAKGPFLHIEGSKESPASVVVVNSGVLRTDDDDAIDKASARRRHSSMQRTEGRKAGPAYSSSTLSMRYNSDTADLTWVCVFCKRGPHCMGPEPMGDLFGPYRIPAMPHGDELSQPGVPSDREVVEEQKRRGGGKHAKSLRASGTTELFTQKLGKKSKRSQSTDGWEVQAGLLQVEGGYEVWLHGTCAMWAPGLCMIGSQMVGLDDAIWTSLRTRCSQCGELGAGVGCVVRNCPLTEHYHCATASDWLLDTETYIARCPSHRTRLRPT
ncbi:uncharacterized protein CG5098 [Homalodisca vitripennis]|uniref:uncharacterized protein CG5098 n=1 Tax=Homalodisca vitripennis TaxID=197043 RepID=UPI001EEC880B|nr:uncharacterized protein CG5098 [Homalodisca vitripennis]XP_046659903.1 uncharacterized protein CG5098 [Homalodisca vitripennis]